MKVLFRNVAFLFISVAIPWLLSSQSNENDFILDKIKPGSSSRLDMKALFGEPKEIKMLDEIRIEYFEARDKYFNQVILFFNNTDVLQWAKLEPIHAINAEDAPLLFLLTSKPDARPGNIFNEEMGVKGETHLFKDEGIYFYVADGKVAEIWLTKSDTDLENIRIIISHLTEGSFVQGEPVDSNKNFNTQNNTVITEILFRDDFDSENNGNGRLNYKDFENWEVETGEVDLIGNGFWDFHPDHGLHLDLDGSANKAGTLKSRMKFRLTPGKYTLEFDLAGNFQRTINTVIVSMGDLYNEEFTFDAKEPFRKIKRELYATSLLEAGLEFQHLGGDNFGLLLDNVVLSKISGDVTMVSEDKGGISYQDKTELDQAPHETDTEESLITYFGIVFDRHDGEGVKILGILHDTPSEHAGLKKGDIIIEVEDISFRELGPQPEHFSEMIKGLPADIPLRCLIQRNDKRFDVWIKPLRINNEELLAFQDEVRERFSNDYARGRRLMSQDDYVGAIEYFKKSLKSKPMLSHQGLGICYYHLGQYKEARKSIKASLKLDKTQPLSWFYGGLNMEALNKRYGAIDAYKKYLKLNHENAEMNAFANERLEQLKKENKDILKSRLLEVIDAIKKEINY